MRRLRRLILVAGCVAALVSAAAGAQAASGVLRVVAAENFYGDIARQIGGTDVAVSSILANPNQDPHLFEVSASAARAVSAASLVIENGINYDPWMDRLTAAAGVPPNHVIVVATLVGRRGGEDPHIWYDPATMPALARALCAAYTAADPAHAAGYAARLTVFETSMRPVLARIASLRARLSGVEVTATEPVFGYMLAALGMVSRNLGFQRSVMNETEASASEIAAIEDDLRSRRVRLLIDSPQTNNAVAERLVGIARASGVGVVDVGETEPVGVSYQEWVMGELDGVEVGK